MSETAWVDPRINAVSAEQARRYLLNHGWKPQSFPGTELLVFAGPRDDDGEPIVLVLPTERMRDYRLRLEGLLRALAAVEDRHPVQVLEEMLSGANVNGAADAPGKTA